MAGSSPGLFKGFRAEAAIPRRRIVKFGALDSTVLLGAAATDMIIGVSSDIDAAIGENVDVIMGRIAEVEAGGAFARGALLTSDAVGRAVVAAPGAGLNNRILGLSLSTATGAGDIIAMLVGPGMTQG